MSANSNRKYPTLVATKEVVGRLVRHGSFGSIAIAGQMHKSTMEFYLYPGQAVGFIDWDIPSIDSCESIGLRFDRTPEGKQHLTDYDGIMSLPKEAWMLLEESGVVVDEEFK